MKRRNEGNLNGLSVSCPPEVCTSGARQVTFTATAGTIDLKTLGDVLCESNSARNQLTSPMRVGAYDTVIGAFVYRPIYYDRISFTDTNDYTTPSFAAPIIYRHIKKPMNFRSFTLGPLKTSGTYTFQVSCPDCLGTKTVICRSYVRDTDAPIGPPQAYTANPYDRDAEGKPYTPVVRVAEVVTQNTNESFTTHETENFVEFRAQVLPEDFAEQSVITWDVIDDPTDNYASALPRQGPVPDPGDKFRGVYRVWLDNEADGRPAPLRYLVTARAATEDQEAVSSYRLKQDEVDKCRQEYVDFGISLAEVPKSTFTAGLHPRYSKQVRDCYAYIYPAVEAQKVDRLIAAGYHPVVTSGYRSPRHNIFYASSTARSTHIFGEAVDINPASLNAEGWKELWESTHTTCGKVLETGQAKTMLWCADGGDPFNLNRGRDFPAEAKSNDDILIYKKANCIHLGNLAH